VADQQGRLIHDPPSPTNPHRPDVDRDPKPEPCVGCKGFHGGVGAEINCLRRVVVNLRTRLEDKENAAIQENARLRAMLSEFEPGRKGSGS
jgi:hypothetical protein